MARTFEDRPAVRERTPLLVGLVGPSGSGKTYSALRLATGFQAVTGGDIYVIDTEARRALHYAETFTFRHVAFGAPFGSLDYLDAIQHCASKGAGTIVIDSMSHEHEGPGGLLEQHDAEVARMSGGDWKKAERVKMLAWQRPKSARRRLINSILQMECNFVFCFRAKEKVKIVTGKEPIPQGFMPVAGEEFVYEMTMKALLLPGANGVPTWESDYPGERSMMKLPAQFREMFGSSPQLTETVGRDLAAWSAGVKVETATAEELVARYEACSDFATLRALEQVRAASWAQIKTKIVVKAASDAAHERIAMMSAPVSIEMTETETDEERVA